MDASRIFSSTRKVLKSVDCYIRNAVTSDVLYVAENARGTDLKECSALKRDIREAALISHAASGDLSAALVGPSGEPCAVFGVVKGHEFILQTPKTNIAQVWLIATSEFDKLVRAHPRLVFTVAKPIAGVLTDLYGCVGNIIPHAVLRVREGMLNRCGARWINASTSIALFYIKGE